MNDRFKELAEQAGGVFSPMTGRNLDKFDTQKFAELIILECIQQTYPDDFKVDGVVPHNLPDAVSRIKEHFGLPE